MTILRPILLLGIVLAQVLQMPDWVLVCENNECTYLPFTVTKGSSVSGLTREEALRIYRARYVPSQNVSDGWNGSVSGCAAGATSSPFQIAVENRINYYREMAGLTPIRLDANYSRKAQSAALMMSANNKIDHAPGGSWACYSSEGAEAAGKANLSIFVHGPAAIDGYIEDPGAGNTFAGHRRWILYPQTQVMGSGDIPGGSQSATNALWVFDEGMWRARPATLNPFVAWPPPGYVPYNTVYSRWSFSLANADFSQASVTMTSGGANMPVTRFAPVDGFGENTLVWQISSMTDSQDWARPAADTVYDVRIDNVKVNGETTSYSYSVIVFDPGN